jgi:hypothetical protein
MAAVTRSWASILNHPRCRAIVALPARFTVLLYTDGLDAGLARMRQHATVAQRPLSGWLRPAEGLRRPLSYGQARTPETGALTQARSGSERPYAEDDRALVEDLAHRQRSSAHQGAGDRGTPATRPAASAAAARSSAASALTA